MPGENTSNPTNANPTTDSGAATEPTTPEAETTQQAAADSPAEGQTKPKAGKVTVDATKRYLSEIVAAHSLSKVGDEIAQVMCGVGPGGILVVDDLDWAVNDIFYLDLRKKLEMLQTWAGDVLADCEKFFNPPPVVIVWVKETSEVRTPTE